MVKAHISWKQLCRAICFLLVLAILLAAVSAVTFPKLSQEVRKYHADYIYGETQNTLDYVVVGDSNVSEGISPLDIWNSSGAAGYVCSEPYATLCRTYYMLYGIFKTQHPSLVILDTDSFFYTQTSQSGTESVLTEALQENIPVLRYHNTWKKLTWSALFQGVDWSKQDLLKGHAWSITVKASTNTSYMKQTVANAGTVPVLLQFYMRKIQQLCANNNAKLLIISIPNTSFWNDARHNTIQQYAESIGVTFLDLNEHITEIGINWDTDTRDKGIHLNAFGAQKTSIWLSDYLKQNYGLTDHRSDDSYSGWNTSYQKYLAKFTT